MGQQLFEGTVGTAIDRFHVMGVNACGCVDKIVLFRQFQRTSATFDIATDVEDIVHAMIPRPLDNFIAVAVVLVHVEMSVSINDHRTRTPSGSSSSKPPKRIFPSAEPARIIP
jgi:hypothetical protein